MDGNKNIVLIDRQWTEKLNKFRLSDNFFKIWLLVYNINTFPFPPYWSVQNICTWYKTKKNRQEIKRIRFVLFIQSPWSLIRSFSFILMNHTYVTQVTLWTSSASHNTFVYYSINWFVVKTKQHSTTQHINQQQWKNGWCITFWHIIIMFPRFYSSTFYSSPFPSHSFIFLIFSFLSLSLW